MNRNPSKMKKTEILLRPDLCCGCGECVDACRRGVLRLADTDRGRIVRIADAERCAGCRACERSCTHDALVVRKIEGRKFDPKRVLQAVLPLILAWVCALPRPLNAEAWHALDGWKIFGLFVLFHILFSHLRIPQILKKHFKKPTI